MAPSLRVERSLLSQHCTRLACIDEVGRGALAGPVTVGVVVLDQSVRPAPEGVRDSKLVPAAQREALVPRIEAWCASHAVAHATNDEIDAVGIIGALRMAGMRALALIDPPADLVLLDGSHDWLTAPPATLFDSEHAPTPPVVTRVKADLDCTGVAAASILAKVARDSLMSEAASRHPAFGWDRNKGYASADHRAALRAHGPTPLHRVSWRLDGSSTGA